MNKIAVDFIKKWEDFKSEAYPCSAGVMTIGYGTTIYADGKKVKKDEKITEEQALKELLRVIENDEKAVGLLVKVPLSENEEAALISFCYNVGVGDFKTSTLLKLLNKGDKVGASNEFKKWKYVKGKISKGLVNRRAAEKILFLTSQD